MSFNIIITSDAASAQGVIALLNARVSNPGLTAFLHGIVDPFVRARIDQRFLGEGDDVVGAWHPLTVATNVFRSAKGFSPAHPINRRTGAMHRALVDRPGRITPSGVGMTLTNPPPGGSFGLTDLKIQTAQSGKTVPLTPPRPVLGFNQNDLLFITSELTAYLIA